MNTNISKSSCDCCGTCCRNGGPALHTADHDLLKGGILRIEDLITVRKGEYVYLPLSDKPQLSQQEFLKIRGKGEGWCCMFFDEENSLCTFYRHRPIACRTLKCWAPDDILAITGKNLLTRSAVISSDDVMGQLIQEHEIQCSLFAVHELVDQLLSDNQSGDSALQKLSSLVNTDIRYREAAVSNLRLSLEKELFYFGRPLFQLIMSLGLKVVETSGSLVVKQ